MACVSGVDYTFFHKYFVFVVVILPCQHYLGNYCLSYRQFVTDFQGGCYLVPASSSFTLHVLLYNINLLCDFPLLLQP